MRISRDHPAGPARTASATSRAMVAGLGVLVHDPADGQAGGAAGHDVADLGQDALPPARVAGRAGAAAGARRAGATEEEHRDTPTLATMRATASTRAAPGSASGTGTFSTGAPMSWATTAAKTMASVSRAIRPSRHDRDSTSASRPGARARSSTVPEQLEGGRRQAGRSGRCASCA